MNSYGFGILAGRLFLAYAIVWAAMLLVSKIDWRGAFKLTHRWYGIASIAGIYVLGLAAFVT
jgi:hypothetical protein